VDNSPLGFSAFFSIGLMPLLFCSVSIGLTFCIVAVCVDLWRQSFVCVSLPLLFDSGGKTVSPDPPLSVYVLQLIFVLGARVTVLFGGSAVYSGFYDV